MNCETPGVGSRRTLEAIPYPLTEVRTNEAIAAVVDLAYAIRFTRTENLAQDVRTFVTRYYRYLTTNAVRLNMDPAKIPALPESPTVADVNRVLPERIQPILWEGISRICPRLLMLKQGRVQLDEASGVVDVALDLEVKQSVVVSSIVMRTHPPEWPHYVAAKGAIEALAASLSTGRAWPRFIVPRPPLLATDLTNTPGSRLDARPPEVAAARIVTGLLADDAPPFVIVEDFP